MELKRKKGRKKQLRNRILLIVLFVAIDIFLIYSFIRIREAVNINQLNNKFNELLEVNFTSNNYDNETNTTGKYKIAEDAMNNYFISYSTKTREILDIINDDRIKSLLSIENYSSEDQQFNNNLNYVTNTRKDLDVRFAELYNYSSEEYIDNYIGKVSSDPKVKKIFKKYMYSIEANDHFDDCNSLLKKKQAEINNILDVSKEVFTFLAANEGKWLIQDGQIQFANNDLKVQYDGYIARVK